VETDASGEDVQGEGWVGGQRLSLVVNLVSTESGEGRADAREGMAMQAGERGARKLEGMSARRRPRGRSQAHGTREAAGDHGGLVCPMPGWLDLACASDYVHGIEVLRRRPPPPEPAAYSLPQHH